MGIRGTTGKYERACIFYLEWLESSQNKSIHSKAVFEIFFLSDTSSVSVFGENRQD